MKTCRLFSNINKLLLCIAIWLLCVFNYQNMDTYFYKLIYEGYYHTEYLFARMCFFFYSRGIDYQYLYTTCETIALLLTFSTVFYYTKSVKLVLLLWLIYPFPYLVVGTRNFLGFSLVFFATRFLMASHKKWGTVVYILLVIIASGFQASMLIYLSLVFCKMKLPNKICISLEYSLIFLGIIILSMPMESILEAVGLDTGRLATRLSQKNLSGFVISAILQTLCSFHAYFLVKKSKAYMHAQHKENIIFRFIMIMNILLLFYMFDSVFYRLNYNMMIFSYILCAQVYSNPTIKWRHNEKIIYYILSFSLAGIHALNYLLLGNYSILIKDIFNHNIILDYIIGRF